MMELMEKFDFDLFSPAPLAELLRPKTLDEVVGQDDLLGPAGRLRLMLANGNLGSVILWGLTVTGKTTIARLLGGAANMVFEPISAVFDGVAELRKIFARANERRQTGQSTLLFVDEVHRFNKAQQDGLLPRVEDGTVTLVGATAENPSFALNGALLSRVQVLVLERLDKVALEAILVRLEENIGHPLPLEMAARADLCAMADGDGRYLLNMAALLIDRPEAPTLDTAAIAQIVTARVPRFDKAGDQHYNLMSALHKSLRASNADAGLYWLNRMLEGGEDPHYILRRLTRFASEDIGLAEQEAVPRALAAWRAYERLGRPEGDLSIASLVIDLATAPKSNALYKAFKQAQDTAAKTGSLPPPSHILNAPTKMMKDMGYGAIYAYDHADPDGLSGQNCFPDGMERARYYKPVERGHEREIAKRLAYWDKLCASKQIDDQT